MYIHINLLVCRHSTHSSRINYTSDVRPYFLTTYNVCRARLAATNLHLQWDQYQILLPVTPSVELKSSDLRLLHMIVARKIPDLGLLYVQLHSKSWKVNISTRRNTKSSLYYLVKRFTAVQKFYWIMNLWFCSKQPYCGYNLWPSVLVFTFSFSAFNCCIYFWYKWA